MSESTTNPSHLGSVLPSNRSFGLLFTIVFLLVAGYSWFEQLTRAWVYFWLALSGLFLFLTFMAPGILSPLNKAWYRLGLLMGKVVSPIVLGILFFIVISPVAIVTRLFGRDVLLLRKRNVNSYWIERNPPGPQPESFKEQF